MIRCFSGSASPFPAGRARSAGPPARRASPARTSPGSRSWSGATAPAGSLRSVPGVTVKGICATREAPGTYPELEILKYVAVAGGRALTRLVDSLPVLFGADRAAVAAARTR
ncbi:hypothetical protein [Thermoactinospora rubra]|uniref:hypothetical protein n=1 Tax=Thermoactinospora rubra TaxID=1088767 RepID=UPI000A1121B2|nr:hypothetical protein [Thermoactinospora rubra]